jgi:uncharacterized protein YdcH (DUF465 family)
MEKLKVELDIIHQQSIESICKNLSSIFAKEDVINILGTYYLRIVESIKQIEYNEALQIFEDYEKQNKEIKEVEENINEPEAKFSIDEIKKAFKDIIGNDDYYEVDNGTAEFEIRYGNEIVLESVSVDVSFNDILFNLTQELINTQE